MPLFDFVFLSFPGAVPIFLLQYLWVSIYKDTKKSMQLFKKVVHTITIIVLVIF